MKRWNTALATALEGFTSFVRGFLIRMRGALCQICAWRVHQSLYKPVLRPLVPSGASGSALDQPCWLHVGDISISHHACSMPVGPLLGSDGWAAVQIWWPCISLVQLMLVCSSVDLVCSRYCNGALQWCNSRQCTKCITGGVNPHRHNSNTTAPLLLANSFPESTSATSTAQRSHSADHANAHLPKLGLRVASVRSE